MNYRWVLSLAVLVSLSLTACQPIQPLSATPNTALAAETGREEANKAVVQQLYEESFNQKNLGFLAEAVDANVVVHDLDYGADGLDHALFLTAFPDLQATVDLWMAEDDMVMTLVTFSGTHQAEFLGVAPTGKPMTISLVDIFRFEDGKVVELWHYVPVADILEQIGASPQTTASTASDTHEAKKAVVQRIYEEAFNQKNPGFFAEVMDLPNLANHELDYGADGLDPALLMAGFPDLQATVDRIVVAGDMVTALVTFSGTHQGEFLGVAPTGRPMTFSLIDLFRFQDGKVVELWHYVPVADILEQISDPPTQ